MSDAFWTGLWSNLPAIITALVGAVVTAIMTWRNGVHLKKQDGAIAEAAVKAKEAHAAAAQVNSTLTAKVGELKNHIDTIGMTKEQAELMIVGAERRNMVRGMEIERTRNTGPMPLGK